MLVFDFLSPLVIIAAVLVITAQNPVHSVFFLVIVFLKSAFLLFLLEVEFISLLFILVYVGAIAVLFLFVVMMLDIKVLATEENFFVYLPLGLFISSVLFTEIFLLLQDNFVLILSLDSRDIYTDWLFSFDSLTNIDVLGQVLYTHYFFYFLIAGILLLVAMVGAIVLTHSFLPKVKHQLVFRQVLRNKKNSLFL